jgi:hypothetical protein
MPSVLAKLYLRPDGWRSGKDQSGDDPVMNGCQQPRSGAERHITALATQPPLSDASHNGGHIDMRGQDAVHCALRSDAPTAIRLFPFSVGSTAGTQTPSALVRADQSLIGRSLICISSPMQQRNGVEN